MTTVIVIIWIITGLVSGLFLRQTFTSDSLKEEFNESKAQAALLIIWFMTWAYAAPAALFLLGFLKFEEWFNRNV